MPSTDTAIESELLELTRRFEHLLPKEDIENIRHLILAREWGIGFEILCTQLFEYEVNVSPEDYRKLELLGNRMNLDAKSWSMLGA